MLLLWREILFRACRQTCVLEVKNLVSLSADLRPLAACLPACLHLFIPPPQMCLGMNQCFYPLCSHPHTQTQLTHTHTQLTHTHTSFCRPIFHALIQLQAIVKKTFGIECCFAKCQKAVAVKADLLASEFVRSGFMLDSAFPHIICEMIEKVMYQLLVW